MLSSITYYELLGCPPYATVDEIKQCYTNKIYELTKQNVTDIENYQTAYHVLTDPARRKQYDDSIGILHRNRIPLLKRIIFFLGRIIFTLLDMLSEFIWSFLIVIIIAFVAYSYKNYKSSGTFNIHGIVNTIEPLYLFISAGILSLSLIAYLFHPTIRRLNRNLKHKLRKYK